MRLYVDDIRREPEGWVRARTVTEAIRILATQVCSEVSLDHDITCYIMDEYKEHASEETFEAVAYFIAFMPEDIRPKTVRIHTANPAGADKMIAILRDKVPNLYRFDQYLKYE